MGAARGGEEYRAAALLMAPIHCCISVTSLHISVMAHVHVYMYMDMYTSYKGFNVQEFCECIIHTYTCTCRSTIPTYIVGIRGYTDSLIHYACICMYTCTLHLYVY